MTIYEAMNIVKRAIWITTDEEEKALEIAINAMEAVEAIGRALNMKED